MESKSLFSLQDTDDAEHHEDSDSSIQRVFLSPARHLSASSTRLQAWFQWLHHERIPLRERLLEAFRNAPFPAHILHHFACDCAERTLQHSLALGSIDSTISATLLETIAHKRAWLEGQLETSELLQTRESIWPLLNAIQPSSSRLILRAVYGCTSTTASHAARYATQYTASTNSHSWQCQHLIQLLSSFLHQQQTLLQLLQRRQFALSEKLIQHQQLYEDALFYGP